RSSRLLPALRASVTGMRTLGCRGRRADIVLNPFHRCSLLSARLTTPHKDAIAAALSLALPPAFYRLFARYGKSRFWPVSLRGPAAPGGGVIANTFRDRWRVTLIVVHRYSFHAVQPSSDVRRFISCCP